jgi:hypothetical protein
MFPRRAPTSESLQKDTLTTMKSSATPLYILFSFSFVNKYSVSLLIYVSGGLHSLAIVSDVYQCSMYPVKHSTPRERTISTVSSYIYSAA